MSSLAVSITIATSGSDGRDLTGRTQPAAAGHGHVHQHDVGPQPHGEVHRRHAVLGLADHLVAPRAEQGCEPVTEQRVVVGEQDPHRSAARPRR